MKFTYRWKIYENGEGVRWLDPKEVTELGAHRILVRELNKTRGFSYGTTEVLLPTGAWVETEMERRSNDS